LFAAVIGLGSGIYFVARYGEMLILFSSIVGSHDLIEDSVANSRGDEITAFTDASGGEKAPARTTLRLRQAKRWFSATLLEATSYGFRWSPKWRSDNALELYVDFGCLVNRSQPVMNLGSIHIIYHYKDNDKSLDLDLARSGRNDPGACRDVHQVHERGS
jgi:hypothetical protein